MRSTRWDSTLSCDCFWVGARTHQTLGVDTLGVYTVGVYTLEVYTLGVYSLGQHILELCAYLPHSAWEHTVGT